MTSSVSNGLHEIDGQEDQGQEEIEASLPIFPPL